MKTSTKVAIGGGVVAVAALGFYLWERHKAPATAPGAAQGAATTPTIGGVVAPGGVSNNTGTPVGAVQTYTTYTAYAAAKAAGINAIWLPTLQA